MASKKGSNYFRYLFTLTSFLGLPLHPMNLKGASKIFYSIYGFVFVVFLPLAHATSQLAELPNVADDLKLITSILSFTFMDIIGLIKITMAFLKREGIYKMCMSFETGKMRPDEKRGGAIEFAYVHEANKDMLEQAVAFQLSAILIIFPRVSIMYEELHEYRTLTKQNFTLETKVPLPFLANIPFEHDEGLRFWGVITFQVVCGWLYAQYICGIDVILCGCMAHVKAQMLILKNYIGLFLEKCEEKFLEETTTSGEVRFERLQSVRSTNGTMFKLAPEILKHAKVIVKDYVVHHMDIIEFCNKLEQEYTALILLQVASSSGMFCFILFQIYDSEVLGMEFVGKVCYLQLIMYQLYRYCIKGNDVTEHSLAISDAIYCCEWIAADDSIQKSLKLMIMRAQRPIKFTAAKFMSLSLGTFMAVLKTSFSYFMFLRRLQE